MPLPFGSSERSTIEGWELQLVDRDSRDLRQSADAIIDRATTHGQARPRRPSGDAAQHHRGRLQLPFHGRRVPRRSQTGLLISSALGIRPAAPVPPGPTLSPARADSGYGLGPDTLSSSNAPLWGQQMLLYGVHVHVGVEDRAKILPSRPRSPPPGHLQALSASPPSGRARTPATPQPGDGLPAAAHGGYSRQSDTGGSGIHGRRVRRTSRVRTRCAGTSALARVRDTREPRLRCRDQCIRGRRLRRGHPRPRRALHGSTMPESLSRFFRSVRRRGTSGGLTADGRDPDRLT